MFANVRDKFLRKLATRVELGKTPNNGAPDKLPMALDFGGRWVPRRVEIEGVFERGDGLGDVTAQPLQPLVHGGGGVLGGCRCGGLRGAGAL